MKKLFLFILGVWTFLGTLITPMALFFLFLCLTGLVYQYDGTMDEGTAFFVGALLLFFWLAFVLFPSLAFFKRIRQRQKGLRMICFCALSLAFVYLRYTDNCLFIPVIKIYDLDDNLI